MIDLFSLIKDMGKMEAKMKELSERLSEIRTIGLAGGGMVEITCNGKKDILDIKIEEGVEKDQQMLKDLLLSAIADAQKKAEGLLIEEIKNSFSLFSL